MTTGTGYRSVLTLKGVRGSRMIERFYSLNLVKGYLRMALSAVLPEFIVMNVLVTIGTFPKGQAFKLLQLLPILNGHFMAKLAIYLSVFPTQWEPCLCMIKFICGLKHIKIMA
jgi:hypothetical protein